MIKTMLKGKQWIFYFILFSSGCIMLIFNFLTPMLADDYSYTFSWYDRNTITNLSEAFLSIYAHYFSWGGRVITHFIATVFLLIGKPVFNVFNTVVYCWLAYIVYRYAAIHTKKGHCLIYLAVHLCLWFVVPAFGQDFLWLIGACNYLWPSAFIFTFIWPYYQYAMTGKLPGSKVLIWFMPVLGLLAGWGNENTSGAGIFFVIILLFLIRKQEHKIPLWMFISLGTQIIGFILMVIAPGNYIRLERGTEDIGFLLTYGGRLSVCNQMIYDYMLPFLLAYIFLLVLLCYQKIDVYKKWIAGLFGITALANNYVMLIVTEYPERAALGTVLFLTIGFLYCVSMLLNQDTLKWASAITCCLLAVFSIQYTYALMDIGYTYRVYNRRIASIIEQRDAGIMDIVTYRIEPKTKFNGLYGLEDLQGYTAHWLNGNTSNYFGINSIVAFPEEKPEE